MSVMNMDKEKDRELNTLHCEGALRNIEKEILRECGAKGIEVNENFINFYINLLALDPSWGVTSKMMLERSDVQKFIKFIVSKMQRQDTPSMIALKMQLYFSYNFHMKHKMLKRNRTELLGTLKLLEQDILDVRSFKEPEDLEIMYKKIVYYITLIAGLGKPTEEAVFKEVRAALGSILDHNELREFLTQARIIKLENLHEFAKLVTGIRLFNKDCGKGGEGMEELPKLINEALDATNVKLQSTLVSVMDKVNLMTTALDSIYLCDLDERTRYIIVCILPKGVTMADVDYVKDCLIAYRQQELYIRKIIDEVDRIESKSTYVFDTFQRALVSLHQVVKHRIAIPVNQVFPHFIKLSEIWCSLQDQTVLLAKMVQIMNNLQKYIKNLSFNDAVAENMLPPEGAITDTERMDRTTGHIERHSSKVEIIDSANYLDIDRVKMEYLGFCAWKLCTTEGALIPGNPSLGFARFMKLNFVFSSVMSGEAFSINPEKSIMETINLARRKPELIHFLNIRQHLVKVQDILELVKEPPLLPLTEDVSIATEMHPIESNIDRNYFWNVWDLRRQAIMLANLTHCRTVACQTKKTHYRGSFRGQTYGTKEQNVQTKIDNYSNVPKPSAFIFGLRGRKDNKQFIVDLTRPVEE